MADLTYLLNSDAAASPNQFYALAKTFFDPSGTVVEAPPEGQTLEGVFNDLKARSDVPATINLVSRASGFASIDCPVTLASQAAGRRTTTVDDLQAALAAKSLEPPGQPAITDGTRIVIYGCDVGRSEKFLRMLSGLFGGPGELLAPLRLGAFTPDGKHRLAQTWSLVRKPPLVLNSADPVGGWPDYRTQFVNDASVKFGAVTIPGETGGVDRVKGMLTTAAANATTALGPAFFFEETVQILPDGPQNAAAAAASLAPRSNGDPVTALPETSLGLDDTTLVTTISGADAFPANPASTEFAITVAILAQIVDEDVLIAEGPDYRRVTASEGLAPALGPDGAGGTGSGGSDGGGISAEFQAVIDKLLAGGVAQTDIDAILAAIPRSDATDGSTTDVPADDAEETAAEDEEWPVEASDYLQPAPEDLV
jgi:hypothetical protein